MKSLMRAAAPVGYRRLLVAVDSSPHSEAATREAAMLAKHWDSTVTGLHAFAARLHDRRFRQMENVLPERFQVEQELEHQRTVHESLITKGLDLVSDSYLDQTETVCNAAKVRFERRGREGKNYRVVLQEAREGAHDLLVVGYQGLGAVQDGVPGTVCLRVVRKSPIDTLVVKTTDARIGAGPIVVGLDGSHQSYGALLAALDLGQRLGAPVHAVAVFDPHFHNVAFNRIREVLSDEAGKVFRVEDQEQLHAELIDSGLAKIYQSNLQIGARIAAKRDVPLQTFLLAGKPWQAVAQHCKDVGASLLVIGKLGVHADAELDIGGNTELLLSLAPTSLLIVQRSHVPDIEVVARETVSWTPEAEARLTRVPEFVQPMVRKAVLMWALDRGHTVITSEVMDQATQALKPSGMGSSGSDGGPG